MGIVELGGAMWKQLRRDEKAKIERICKEKPDGLLYAIVESMIAEMRKPMGLFDKIKEPIFLKDDSEAERQLEALRNLRNTAIGDQAEQLDDEIRRVDAGIFGEKTVRYELANSHIPMFVLHDLYLEYEGLTAQIDYLIITRKHQFVVECKNLYGNIEINNTGDFTRSVTYGRRTKKEGIYSPVTQNRRHLELIKQIRKAEKRNILAKAIFEKSFDSNYRSVVVLANPKTVLYDRYAKKEVRKQVIKADQLVQYIREADANSKTEATSEKVMEELAQFFLGIHKQQAVDYTEKYRVVQQRVAPVAEPEQKIAAKSPVQNDVSILCPQCGLPMVKRVAAKGPNAGKEFYGCSAYPKCKGIINIQ